MAAEPVKLDETPAFDRLQLVTFQTITRNGRYPKLVGRTRFACPPATLIFESRLFNGGLTTILQISVGRVRHDPTFLVCRYHLLYIQH